MLFEAPGAKGLKITCECGQVVFEVKADKDLGDLTVSVAPLDGWIEIRCGCGHVVKITAEKEGTKP